MDFHGGSDGKESASVQETRVQSLGWEDPLEKGMATHSSILAWRIPWTEEPGRLQSTGLQHNRVTNSFPFFTYVYMYECLSHFAVEEKLTTHCKSAALQLKVLRNGKKIYIYIYKGGRGKTLIC